MEYIGDVRLSKTPGIHDDGFGGGPTFYDQTRPSGAESRGGGTTGGSGGTTGGGGTTTVPTTTTPPAGSTGGSMTIPSGGDQTKPPSNQALTQAGNMLLINPQSPSYKPTGSAPPLSNSAPGTAALTQTVMATSTSAGVTNQTIAVQQGQERLVNVDSGQAYRPPAHVGPANTFANQRAVANYNAAQAAASGGMSVTPDYSHLTEEEKKAISQVLTKQLKESKVSPQIMPAPGPGGKKPMSLEDKAYLWTYKNFPGLTNYWGPIGFAGLALAIGGAAYLVSRRR